MKIKIFRLFKNKIQCSSNEILNKIKHNVIQNRHIFFFTLAFGVAAFQGKAFAYNKSWSFTSYYPSARCAENLHSHQKNFSQLSLNNTNKYKNISYFDAEFLKKISDKSILFLEKRHLNPHSCQNFESSNDLNFYTNKEKIMARNFYKLQENKYKISYSLLNSPTRPLFPKVIQPVSLEFFIDQPSPKTSILNRNKTTQILETQDPHFSQILLCANLFISALKVNAKQITQPTNEIKYNSYTQQDIKNTTIENTNTKFNTKKKSKKQDNTLILKIFHPLAKDDYIICCEKNSQNIPVGAIGTIVEIIDGRHAKCQFSLKENWLLFTPKQKKILIDYASQSLGTGLFVTPCFLKNIKILLS